MHANVFKFIKEENEKQGCVPESDEKGKNWMSVTIESSKQDNISRNEWRGYVLKNTSPIIATYSFTLPLRYPKYLSKRNLIKHVFMAWKSKMEFFLKIYNGFQALAILGKKSILDVWYVSDTFSKLALKILSS